MHLSPRLEYSARVAPAIIDQPDALVAEPIDELLRVRRHLRAAIPGNRRFVVAVEVLTDLATVRLYDVVQFCAQRAGFTTGHVTEQLLDQTVLVKRLVGGCSQCRSKARARAGHRRVAGTPAPGAFRYTVKLPTFTPPALLSSRVAGAAARKCRHEGCRHLELLSDQVMKSLAVGETVTLLTPPLNPN